MKPVPSFAGFRVGQGYQLRYTREFDEVRIEMDHAAVEARPLVVTVEQFNKWFQKNK